MLNPNFSIIIPACNCERTIRLCLEAMKRLQVSELREIIVVDDGSTDKTADIVKSFKEVRYFFQENKGPAAARNRGANEAKGEVVCFTDSDCMPRGDWLKRLGESFSDGKIAAVAGSYGLANPRNSLAQCIQDEIVFRHKKLLPSRPKVFGSYNVAIRKKIFDAVGGFDESYRFASGEDNDLSYRIRQKGYDIFFSKNALVDHFHTESLLKYLKEQWRHGFWRMRLYRQHPRMAKGDDYTFWKDIIEVPLSFAGLLVLALSFLPGIPFVIKFLGGLIIFIHISIELFFGINIGGPERKGFLLALVMFFRSYARTFGLVFGLSHLLLFQKTKTKFISIK